MKQKQIDKTLLFIILALAIFGLIMVASAGVSYSQTRFADANFFIKHQFLFGFLPGVILLYFIQKIDYHFWKEVAVPFFLFALILLVLVLIPGIGSSAYGASRWLNLGPISFQPSEITKIAIILYLATWLDSRGKKKIEDVYEGLVPFLGILSVASFLILKQPDTGTVGMIAIISLTMFFVSGAKIAHLLAIALSGVMGLVGLIMVAPYRMNRFLVFLDPTTDPQGIGYQINQALIAIGSGGVFGVGLGHSRQKFNYLPEPVGDSIFAIIGEELGLVGAIVIIGLFVFFALRAMKLARNSKNEFSRLVVIGIASWIIFQAFINMAAISGIIPLTGIPLPFISYGGTSFIFLMFAMGILLNISKESKI